MSFALDTSVHPDTKNHNRPNRITIPQGLESQQQDEEYNPDSLTSPVPLPTSTTSSPSIPHIFVGGNEQISLGDGDNISKGDTTPQNDFFSLAHQSFHVSKDYTTVAQTNTDNHSNNGSIGVNNNAKDVTRLNNSTPQRVHSATKKRFDSISSVRSDQTLVNSILTTSMSIGSTDTLYDITSQFSNSSIKEEKDNNYNDDNHNNTTNNNNHINATNDTKSLENNNSINNNIQDDNDAISNSAKFPMRNFHRSTKSEVTNKSVLVSNNKAKTNNQFTPGSTTIAEFSINNSSTPIYETFHNNSNNKVLDPNAIQLNTNSLRKHLTSIDSTKINNSNRLKESKIALPKGCSTMGSCELTNMINDTSLNEFDNLNDYIIIDVRPFQYYCKDHIKNAINLCLPSTLLRRPTFTLEKCLSTLTDDEKLLFNKYFERTASGNALPKLVFYDNNTNSRDNSTFLITNLVLKFIDSSIWPNDRLFVLKGGFNDFKENHESLVVSGPTSNLNPLTSSNNNNNLLQLPNHRAANTSMSPISLSSSNESSPVSFLTTPSNLTLNPFQFQFGKNSIPGLNHFTLPDLSAVPPVFKTIHHDQVLDDKPDKSLRLLTDLDTPKNLIESIPIWLKNVIQSDKGATKLSENFNSLQIEERNRLNQVMSIKRDKVSPDLPCFQTGVELGNKNRYKDIFPFEHSRVKIKKPIVDNNCLINNDSSNDNTNGSNNQDNDSEDEDEGIEYDSDKSQVFFNNEEEELDPDSSYINASYLHTENTNLNYIATQGPLKETIGDFWKVVMDHNIQFIISLTAQHEHNLEKCAPFWEPGNYESNNLKINLKVLDVLDNFKLSPNSDCICIARILQLKIKNKKFKKVYIQRVFQIQVVSWPDYVAVIDSKDLLSLISLKRYILKTINDKHGLGVDESTTNPDNLILVHCSAGCGRTGVFCSIDSCIELLGRKSTVDEKDKDKDMIYEIVNSFRQQRISMVQNLRQFILIYDAVLTYKKLLVEGGKNEIDELYNWDVKTLNRQEADFKTLEILQKFLA